MPSKYRFGDAEVEAHRFEALRPGRPEDAPAQIRGNPLLLAEFCKLPPFNQEASIKFSDKMFDIQQEDTGAQYLVLDPMGGPGGPRPRCYHGDWIVRMPSGQYMTMKDEAFITVAKPA